MERVFVTGLGFISSIGNDEQTVVEHLRELKHGMELYPSLQVPESPVKLAAPVKDFDVESPDPEDWTYPEQYRLRRENTSRVLASCLICLLLDEAGD